MWLLDPKRAERKRLEEKKQTEEDERAEFAKAVSDGDILIMSYYIDKLMRQTKSDHSSGG